MKTQAILLLSLVNYVFFLAVYFYSVSTLGDVYATSEEGNREWSRGTWGTVMGMGWVGRLAPVRVVSGRG